MIFKRCSTAHPQSGTSAITPANRKRSQTASNDFCSRLPQDLPAQRLFAKNVAGSDISTQEVVLLLLGDKLFRYSRANTPLAAKRQSCFCRQRQWLSNTDFSNPIEPVERKSSPVPLCVAQGLKVSQHFRFRHAVRRARPPPMDCHRCQYVARLN